MLRGEVLTSHAISATIISPFHYHVSQARPRGGAQALLVEQVIGITGFLAPYVGGNGVHPVTPWPCPGGNPKSQAFPCPQRQSPSRPPSRGKTWCIPRDQCG